MSKITNRILKSEPIEWKSLKFIQPDDFKDISDEDFNKLKESLKANNFVHSFNVWEAPDKTLYCLDGYHRCKALRELENEDGVDVPTHFSADFIDCKDLQEAKKFVILYSATYAVPNASVLYEYIDENSLNLDSILKEISVSVNVPGFGSMDLSDVVIDEPEPEAYIDEPPQLEEQESRQESSEPPSDDKPKPRAASNVETSHTRMAALYYSKEDYEEFTNLIEEYKKIFGLDTTADVLLRLLKDAKSFFTQES